MDAALALKQYAMLLALKGIQVEPIDLKAVIEEAAKKLPDILEPTDLSTLFF